MKYKIKNVCRLSGVVVSALLMASSALAQNIYVASFNNGTIYDYTPGGMQNTFYSGIAFPEGIAFNSSGDLFVASSTGNVVDEITPGKIESTVASVPDPSGMAIDSAGDIFVTGHNDGDIWEIKAGATSATMFAGGLLGPGGLAFDPSGDLFVQAGGTNGVIDEYKDTGGVLSTTPTQFAQNLYDASYLTCDASGNLYVGYNSVNGEVAKITPGQVVSVYATGLNSPGGLAFDASGDLFITSNGTITEIPPGGGTGTVFAPGLGNVTGLAIMPVPEPSTWALAALGGVVFLLRRKKQGCIKPNPCGRS